MALPKGIIKMPLTIDLEREFFKVAKDLVTRKKVKREFVSRIKEISEEWIDNKFRLDILGLK